MNPATNANDDNKSAEESQKGAPPRRFDSTLPLSKKAPASGSEADAGHAGELDLDLGDIQSRLPYGSEDIADK